MNHTTNNSIRRETQRQIETLKNFIPFVTDFDDLYKINLELLFLLLKLQDLKKMTPSQLMQTVYVHKITTNSSINYENRTETNNRHTYSNKQLAEAIV